MEIKILNFADYTTISSKNITCLIKIQMILKLYEGESTKTNFSKSQGLWAGTYKNRTDQPGQIKLSKFPLKYLVLTLAALFLITPNRTKSVKV